MIWCISSGSCFNWTKHFYETLIEKTSQASQIITFASLYLGTGNHEKSLVKALESALKRNQDSNLKVRILLDATRGSRGTQNNSRTMLLPLEQSFSQQCSIHFYHIQLWEDCWRKFFLKDGMKLLACNTWKFTSLIILCWLVMPI